MFIRNTWYAAALSTEIKAELLFARTILNVKIVLYRTSDGQVAALEDRCAHRQVPLSKGRLLGDLVECWYHGLRYERSGKCVFIPSQSAIPQNACVKSFPVAEKHGLIWIWMGAQEPDQALIPDHWVCDSPELAGELNYCPIKCDYRIGIDNILDISHAAFVHVKTLGSQEVVKTLPEFLISDNEVRVRRTLHNEKTPPLYQTIMKLEYIDRVQDVIYWPVGNTRVDTVAHPPGRPDGKSLRVFTTTIFTPETELTTHLFVGMHRDFAIDNSKLTELITQQVFATVLEDKDVAEHLQANWKDDAPIVNIKLDRAAIAARQMLDRLLTKETQETSSDQRINSSRA